MAAGRCINLLSVMEGEIARTGEAGRLGLQSVQPVPVRLPLTPLKCQICPFLLSSNVIIFSTYGTVQALQLSVTHLP